MNIKKEKDKIEKQWKEVYKTRGNEETEPASYEDELNACWFLMNLQDKLIDKLIEKVKEYEAESLADRCHNN